MIHTPIAMSHLRKRAQGSYYKDVAHYRAEWKLLFDNARTHNVEGSLVYIDADEMEKVLDETFNRLTVGTDLQGAAPGGAAGAGGEEEDRPVAPRRSIGRTNSKQIFSDDEEDYLTPSDDE